MEAGADNPTSLAPPQDVRLACRAILSSQPREPCISRRDLNLLGRQSYKELMREGFKPRADVKHWPFKVPVDWAADPFGDRNWMFQLHGWRGVDPILSEYFRTKNPRFLAEALVFALDWFTYHRRHKPTRFSWYDMATGLRAMKIAFLLDASFCGLFCPRSEDAAALLELADDHAQRLQDEKFINLGNHGVFQIVGLALLAAVLAGRPSATSALPFARKMFEKIMRHGYTEEGVHREHSPYYHYFTTVTIRKLAASQLVTETASALLDKAERVQPWLVWPNGRFVEVGDSESKGRPLAGGVVPLFELEDGRSFAIGDFTRSGYAVVRSDPRLEDQQSMLFVTGMAYSTAHKHADELSFALFEHGQPLFVDSGKYGFNRDKWRAYVTSAAAHNTISLHGRRIDRSDAPSQGSFLRSLCADGTGFTVEGELLRPGLFKQKRVIRYCPARSLHVQDEVVSNTEQSFVSSLHFDHRLTPQLTEEGFEVLLKGGKKVRGRLESARGELECVRGQEAPVLGWQSSGYMKMIPTSVVRAICWGRQQRIAWSIELDAW
jgi:hypothetical protein